MKMKIVILSVACLACLIPESESLGLLSMLAGKALGVGLLAAKKAALSIGSASIASRTPVFTETEVVMDDAPVVNPAVVETVEIQPIYGLRTEFLNRYAPADPIYRYYQPMVEPVVEKVQVPTPVYVEQVRAVPQFQRLVSGRLATLSDIAANCLKNKITAIGDLIAALCGHHSVVISESYKK